MASPLGKSKLNVESKDNVLSPTKQSSSFLSEDETEDSKIIQGSSV